MSNWQKVKSCISSERTTLLWTALLAVLLALLAGWQSYSLSKEYYSVALYHFDSAHYRLRAYEAYQTVQASGHLAVAWETFHQKDSLDLTLRALFAPQFLTLVHGHLLVLLTFMALFITLLIYYIVKHTDSWLAGVGVALLVFVFPYMYHPYKGIADYWMDTIATWMLAAAVLCWLLADNLRHNRWSIACSLLLVCTLAERSVIVVYAAPLLLVLFIIASIQRVRQDGVLAAARRSAAFVLPALLLGVVITALRWQELYSHYFISGYDYGTRIETEQRILAQITNDSGISLPIIAAVALYAAIRVWGSSPSRSSIFTMLWLVIALPIEIVVIGQYYHSFYVLWSPLLLVLLAVLLGQKAHGSTIAGSTSPHRYDTHPVVSSVLGVVAIGAALFTQQSVTAQAHNLAIQQSPLGRTYRAVARAIVDAPPSTTVALLFDLMSSPVMNHVIFDYSHQPVPIVQVYTHDQYYIAEYGGSVTTDQIVRTMRKRLDSGKLTLGFAFTDSNSVDRLPYWGGDADPISHQVIIELSDYMRNSPHWKTTGRIESPYGDITVYTFAPQSVGVAGNSSRWR